MKHKIIKTDHGTFERVSAWIEIDFYHRVRSDSELFCYAEEKEGEYGYVTGFTYKRRFYATASFYSLGSMWVNEPYPVWVENGARHAITNVDMDGDLYDPYYLELDADCEKVRLYRKVGCK